MLRMIKKLINNMFMMDMCDTICKIHEHTLIIVPRLVTFTGEHALNIEDWTVGSRVVAWG